MFIWASMARQAKYATLPRVILIFFAMQILLTIPIGVALLRTEPVILYQRIHGSLNIAHFDKSWANWISVSADENGFVCQVNFLNEGARPAAFDAIHYEKHYRILLAQSFNAQESSYIDYTIAITPDYVFYRDSGALLAVPLNLIPAWVMKEANHGELFNHLALYNGYFTEIVIPVFLLISIVVLITQVLIFITAIWMFGHWRKLTDFMTIRERFAVCAFASVPANTAAVLIGFIAPVMHIFISQLIMIYISYKAMKEFV